MHGMSSFDVKAYPVEILPHPDPEVTRIELARIGGYVSVVPKGTYITGDTILYIPEAAIVPMEILEELNMVRTRDKTDKDGNIIKSETIGGLAGSKGTRVKAVKLRGVISQGIVYLPQPGSIHSGLLPLQEGTDYAEDLGIVKYVPEVPASMSGKVEGHSRIRPYTDIENIKKFPHVLSIGEEVVMTEKIHGTNSTFALLDGEFVVASKGLAGKGLVLVDELTEQGESKNLYWQAAKRLGVEGILTAIRDQLDATDVVLFGEIFGQGVQDLQYGTSPSNDGFRAFDLRVDGEYLDYDEFVFITDQYGIARTPVLYRGPFNEQALADATNGKETISGQGTNVREGVVVRPVLERKHDEIGRVCLKSISEDYLTRKGGSEYE